MCVYFSVVVYLSHTRPVVCVTQRFLSASFEKYATLFMLPHFGLCSQQQQLLLVKLFPPALCLLKFINNLTKFKACSSSNSIDFRNFAKHVRNQHAPDTHLTRTHRHSTRRVCVRVFHCLCEATERKLSEFSNV